MLRKALSRHLAGIKGLSGINAFVRESDTWREAARLGKTLPDHVDPMLDAFDPAAGGAVEALEGADAGWAATYMLGGPGLDLALLLRLDGLSPNELPLQLSLIEAKVGWLMLAALSDRTDEIGDIALGTEIGAQVLLDAARARSRRQLADQWIARLERALAPDLIAVAWVRRGASRLAALSGGGMIDRNSEARSQIEALADLAVRARAPQILEPAPGDDPDLPDPDEDQLADPSEQAVREDAMARVEVLGGTRGLAMPVYLGEEAEAVIIAVWSQGSTAGPLRAEAADLVAQVLGEALSIQARAYPSILRRVGNWLWAAIRGIFGPTAWKLKLLLLALALATGVLALWPARFEPSFATRIEAEERRVISAPYDGFLAEAPYQLGDMVAPGSVVVAMENSDLLLQRAQAQSQLSEIESDIQTARALRNSAEVQTLEARTRQVELQLDLLQLQLNLGRFEATETALVVGGDAWRRVGSRVRLGESLLELAAPDTFRVLAFIDEDWVADLGEGDTGTLLLTAYPGDPIPVTLSSVTSDPKMRDGVNTFSAWMEFAAPPQVLLLDGMRGVVRMEGAETSMLGAYTRGATRWLQRTLWRWGG